MDKSQAWDELYVRLLRRSESLRKQQRDAIGTQYDIIRQRRDEVRLVLSLMSVENLDLADDTLVAA